MVRHRNLDPTFKGSNPFSPAILFVFINKETHTNKKNLNKKIRMRTNKNYQLQQASLKNIDILSIFIKFSCRGASYNKKNINIF